MSDLRGFLETQVRNGSLPGAVAPHPARNSSMITDDFRRPRIIRDHGVTAGGVPGTAVLRRR
jgi:hypothetical protein